jgi:FkbM family methyltransferase
MERKTQSFKGHEFNVVRGITHPEYSYFTFEEEEKDLRERLWNIQPGEVVFDVGASYGSYTLTACAMGAAVYAFEPEKTVFDDLCKNLVLNDWFYTRCVPHNKGLWSSETRMRMESYAPHWPKLAISGEYAMDTLDHMAEKAKIGRLDWIKIDVEGAEEHVIRGALETIEKFKPNLLIECHVFLDAALVEKIKALLPGYLFEEIDRPPCTVLYARGKA